MGIRIKTVRAILRHPFYKLVAAPSKEGCDTYP